jgi:folate-binding protein YgfZ
LRCEAAWIDLSSRGKIGVTGEDRARLLHAMSTNNVKELASDAGLYAFFLSAQGRILADAYVWNLGKSLLLDTEPELRQKLHDHLDKYLIADDAYLHDETDRLAAFGVEGPKSLERAADLGLPIPEEKLRVSQFEGGFSARVASTGDAASGLRIFVPIQDKAATMERLNGALRQASAEEARTVRLENGIPRYGEEITERYLVQETGILRAIHANKGCYLGQEIVERVRSRAQVHRHLKHLRLEGESAPLAGTKLQADGKDVAEIVSAVYSPAWHAVAAFAYVRTEGLAEGVTMNVAGTEPPVPAKLEAN